MNKLEQIKKDFLFARKNKDTLAKSLLSTFIGEVELNLKGENPKGVDETVETLAKKFIKNASTINNDVAKEEIKILEHYLPKMASKEEVAEFLKDKDLTLGGRLIGLAKQHFNGNVDPLIVKGVIAELS
jgi:uncharacterized protein YqeY